MDVTEAVALAREHVLNVFAGEQLCEVGLEELEFDADRELWWVTIGFTTPWRQTARPEELPNDLFDTPVRRAYKAVKISDEDRHIVGLIDRVVYRDRPRCADG